MFPKFAAVSVTVLGLLAVASARPGGGDGETTTVTVTQTAPAPTGTNISQCNTGTASCCNTVQQASDPVTNLLGGLLGVVLGPITGLIGLGCTPIGVLGIGGSNNCNQQPVCCTNVQFNGLINIGCSPLIL